MIALPIDSIVPEIIAALDAQTTLVVEAAPGAGKTTRIPPALEAAGFGEVVVLEPRRIAARMAARRVAVERNEAVGESVGYQVRFEQFAGPNTRVRYVTEGILTRRLLSDPQLRGVGSVVLDEFHERHLEGDVALTLLRRLQKTQRPELRLVVMSATLDGSRLSHYLDGAPVIRSEGRLHPLEIRHTPHSADPLETQVSEALESTLSERGHVLVFLPGQAEIRRAMRACEPLARRRGFALLPLHGDLSPEEQDAAVNPAVGRKVIFATNVAESSITIDGVSVVVDSGLARVASESLFTGLPKVEVKKVSRASAIQRAGRAGRTGPGIVIRLYTAEDFHRRPEAETPEIRRRDLTPVSLLLQASGVRDPEALSWLDPPPPEAWKTAADLLARLGASDSKGELTKLGQTMAELPMHPRLAKLLLEVGNDGPLAAALLTAGARLPDRPPHKSDNDLTLLMEGLIEPRIRQLEQQIRRLVRRGGSPSKDLRSALLSAFPDRVGRRRRGLDLQMANGGSAVLATNSSVDAEFLVAMEMEERPDQGAPIVRMAAAIDADWLLDLFPERIKEENQLLWNRESQRVEAVSRLLFDQLAITESRGEPAPEAAAILLTEKAWEAGVTQFVDAEQWARWINRLNFAAEQGALAAPTDERIIAALRQLTEGLRSFAQLREATADGGLQRALLQELGPHAAQRLEQAAPERLRLPSGRNAQIEYAAHQPPWVASRLQDFFGLKETPRVGGGRVPVVVHLLAPNRRPVQMTSDLAGFWERLYPQVRRELSRRYPKHAWPENPYTATKI